MFEQAFRNIDNALWMDAGCTSKLDYTEQTPWLLFLKYLDALARRRTEYVIPLQGKMAARIEHLDRDIVAAGSTAQRKKHEREHDLLRKQLDMLRAFDEQLHHYADLRISLDLDDGVKVNYGKFGALLAEIKAVAGGK